MQATPKYVIADLIESLGTRSFLLVYLCAVFPMTSNGDLAVGVVQGDVFMSWQINNTDTSSDRFVVNPAGSTLIVYPANSVTGNVVSAFTNRVRDVGNVSLGNVSFTLLNLTAADANKYIYKIYPGIEVGGQVLVIAGNPGNVSVMALSSPDENKQYTLQCSAQSTSVPPGMGLTMHYQWKNEKDQIITARNRYSFSSDQSNLIINPLKKEDDGIFVCEAWEHVGAVSKSAPFTLTVNEKQNCELELRVCLVLGFCIPFVIIGIVFVIFKCTVHIRAYYRGLVLGISLGVTFQVDWIIIVILIVTGTTSCTTELGLGHVLVFGVICLIVCIIAVIFRFCPFSFLEGIPKRAEVGKGILIGFLFASVIGIIVVYLICTKDEDNQPEPEVSPVQTYVGSDANFSFMLTEDPNASPVLIKNESGCVVMSVCGILCTSTDSLYKGRVNFTGNTNQKLISFILRNVTLVDAGIYIAVHSETNATIGSQTLIVKDKKSKTNNSGSSSAVSREHVSVQMEKKGFKSDEEERPPAVHTGIQNKVEPNTIGKQTNDRKQPLPPADTGVEDTPKYRPQPRPPQNSENKDRDWRGLSATIDDTPGLANETPRPNKLPPITPKQETVQEEDALDEPKKKRNKKKKKNQMDKETPEDENGGTFQKVN